MIDEMTQSFKFVKSGVNELRFQIMNSCTLRLGNLTKLNQLDSDFPAESESEVQI